MRLRSVAVKTPGAGGRRGRLARLVGVTDDAGITLLELVVTTTIMGLVMAVFTTGLVQMYRMTNRHESAATAQGHLTVTFQRLDRDVRYATAIGREGPGPNGDQFIEYVIDESGVSTCRQLRLTTSKLLQTRMWPRGALPTTPPTWTTLASDVDVTGGPPFTLLTPTNDVPYQRLRLNVSTRPGGGESQSQTNVTFAALNTSAQTSATSGCEEGRSRP